MNQGPQVRSSDKPLSTLQADSGEGLAFLRSEITKK